MDSPTLEPLASPTAFEDLATEAAGLLPAGWQASVQVVDPLTQTLEEVARRPDSTRLDARLLGFTPLPEGYHQPPDPWLLEHLGIAQARVIPFGEEGPGGRLLLLAEDDASRLPKARLDALEELCRSRASALEGARLHLEDHRFASRLRRITEAELAERFTEAAVELLPTVHAAAILSREGDSLTVLRARRRGGASLVDYLRRSLPWAGSHLAALSSPSEAPEGSPVRSAVPPAQMAGFSEGQLFAPLLQELLPERVETVPLEPGGRLAGSLLLFVRGEAGPREERTLDGLATTLASGLDRIRPERRQASSFLYLQHMLRRPEAGIEGVLRTVVEEMLRLLAADAGVLALLDADTGRLLLSEHRGYGHAVLPEVLSLAPELGAPASIAAQVARSGEPYVASDTAASPIYLPADPSIRSEIAVPLRLRGETFGVALASNRSPGFFLPDDVSRFQLFADQLAVAVDNARLLESLRQRREEETARRQRRQFGFHPSLQAPGIEYHFGNLVGDPEGAFGEVYRAIERVARREADTVLLVGETGTGKEMVAHAIHNASPRRDRPMVATNFAALGGDPNLIQSELFGHEKGAFTGALRRRRGCFEKADASTLLIDELGDITPAVQVKLLRVLGRSSRREITRLGGEEIVTSDVRVIAATNKDLRREIEAERFREDLYYRLSALVIRLPPLRERPQDLPLLTCHILSRLAPGADPAVEPEATRVLAGYSWPGNVRQLESVLLRALVMHGAADRIDADDVRRALAQEGPAGTHPTTQGDGFDLDCPLPPPEGWFWRHVWEPWKSRRLEAEEIRRLLARTLAETGGFYSRAAERLGVSRAEYQRFLDFLQHHGLKVDHRPFRRSADRGATPPSPDPI